MTKRVCQGCRITKETSELYKITKEFQTGELIFDPSSKTLGRSTYVCKNKECIKLFLKKKSLNRTLKVQDTKKIETILEGLIK